MRENTVVSVVWGKTYRLKMSRWKNLWAGSNFNRVGDLLRVRCFIQMIYRVEQISKVL